MRARMVNRSPVGIRGPPHNGGAIGFDLNNVNARGMEDKTINLRVQIGDSEIGNQEIAKDHVFRRETFSKKIPDMLLAIQAVLFRNGIHGREGSGQRPEVKRRVRIGAYGA